MPWKPSDAPAKTKKADTPKKKRMWADIATRLKAAGASDQSAIMQANGVLKKRSGG